MEERTLLILGAGASFGYGLPLGEQLRELVIERLGNLEPHPTSLAARDSTARSIYHQQLVEARESIRRSRAPTIDAYLRTAPHASLARLAMAAVLWQLEDRALKSQNAIADDWLAWLLHYKAVNSLDDFKKNNFAVASFNYDRVPQGLLATMLAEQFSTTGDEALARVSEPPDGLPSRFVHLHGDLQAPLGSSPDSHIANSALVRSWYRAGELNQVGESLSIIHDQSAQLSVQKKLRTAINWAERVFVLGIAYHDEMLKAIDPDLCSTKTFVGGTGFKLRKAKRQRVQEWFGKHFVLGDPDQNCTEFLDDYMR